MNKQTYLPGLNGLRFFAAFAVIITHLELIKMYKGLPHLWSNPNIAELGALGVIFFFVLSGFLITYLMFKEEELAGSISIKKFFLRRVFRIFPLYYLLVFIGFFVVFDWEFIRIPSQYHPANQNFYSYLGYYIFLLPNLSIGAFDSSFPHIGQLWSIGVEEHFYLMWPFIFIFSKHQKLRVFIMFFVLILGIKLTFWGLIKMGQFSSESALFWSNLWASEKLESMAIGGIGAYFWFKKPTSLKFLKFWPGILVSIAIVFLGINFSPSIIQDGLHIIYSILFLGIIIRVLQDASWQRILEFKPFNYLGQISFGLYVYHLLIVTIVINCLLLIDFENQLFFNIIYYFTSIVFTIFISHISYKYYEAYFLKLKQKFK